MSLSPVAFLRKHAISITLVLVAVGLGLYVWLIDRGTMSTGEQSAREGSIFPAWRRGDVTRIELHSGDKHIILARNGADAAEIDFRMVAPVDAATEPATIDRLLATLEHGFALRKLEQDPSDFGAERVRGHIQMGTLGFDFVLGGPSQTPEGSSYFRVDNGKAFVVNAEFASELLRDADSFRDRTIVPYFSVALRQLKLVRPASTLTLTRMDSIGLRIDESGLRASRKTIDLVWGAFATMRAESFLSDSDATRLTQTPRVHVTMLPEDEHAPPCELLVGEACPGHPDDIAVLRILPKGAALPDGARGRLGACVPKAVLEGLQLSADLLADHGLLSMHVDEAEEVHADRMQVGTQPALTFEWARKGPGFHQRLPDDRDLTPTESDALTHYLTILMGETAPAVRKAEAKELTPVLGTMVFSRDKGRVTERIRVGLVHGKIAAFREQDAALLEWGNSSPEALLPHSALLRDLAFWRADTEPKSILLDCGVKQQLSRIDGIWQLDSPAFPLDHARVLELVDSLRRAQAERWIDDAPVHSTRACRVTLTTTSGTSGAGGDAGGSAQKTTLVFLDSDEPTFAHATIEGSNGVFSVPRALEQAVSRIYVDRIFLPDTDAQAITKATLRLAGGAPKVFDFAADAGALDLRAELSVLRADEVLKLGPDPAFNGAADQRTALDITLDLDGAHKTRGLRLRIGTATEPIWARYDGVDATFSIGGNRLDAIRQAAGLRVNSVAPSDAGTPAEMP